MDNCEVYSGLRDLSELLRITNDPDWNYYRSFVNAVATGISGLYRTSSSGYLHADAATVLDPHFYPGATAQVFPTAFDVTPEISAGRADNAWTRFKKYAVNWSVWPNGGKGANNLPDAYPWLIDAYSVIKRQTRINDISLFNQAIALINSVENNFYIATQRPFITINELGFYISSKKLLGF